MKKFIIILSITIGIIGFSNWANAQYFQKLYGTSNDDILFKGMKLTNPYNNANYAMIGSTNSTALHFLTVDNLGAVNFENTYTLNGSIYSNTFTEMVNGNGGLGGYACAAKIIISGTDYLMFAIVDASGAVSSSYKISMGSETILVQAICESATPNGGGRYEYYITGSIGNDMFVIDIDEGGNLIWSETYDYHGGWEDRGLSIILDPYNSSQLVVSGYTYDNPNNNYDGFLSWIDISNGNLINYIQYDYSVKDVFWSIRPSTCNCSGNSYLISGEVKNTGTVKDMLVMNISSSGTINWQKYFDFAHNRNTENCAFDAIDYLNGSNCCEVYATGNAQGYFGGADIQVVKLDGSGVGISEFAFGGTEGDESRSINYDDNSSTYPSLNIFGFSSSWGAGARDFYFIKPYRNGVVGCNFHASSTTGGTPSFSTSSTSAYSTISTSITSETLSPNSTGSTNTQCNTNYLANGDNSCHGNTCSGGGGGGEMIKKNSKSNELKINLTPNPINKENEILNLNFNEGNGKTTSSYKQATITIYDMVGKQYLRDDVKVDPSGNISIPINGISFSTGLYIIKIVLDNDIVKTKYFTIQ